jgi:hypothetical protein
MTTKFNWAYCDRFGDNQIGQLGYGFSLILLSKYGNTKRPDKFYAEKYFKAFPKLVETENTPLYETTERHLYNCYSMRTFDRFLKYFGLVTMESVGEKWSIDSLIAKTDLFDKLIKVRPHIA